MVALACALLARPHAAQSSGPLFLASVSPGAAAPGGVTEITLLYDTHFHGRLSESGVSLAHYAALVDRIRSSKPNVFFVGSGDDITLSLPTAFFHGRQMVEALNIAALDVDTFGDHDFDLGSGDLAALVGESEFAWVSANVRDRRTGGVFAAEHGARQYVVVEVQGTGLGFTGVAPPETVRTSRAGAEVEFADPAGALLEVVPRMIEAGAGIVVVLSHVSRSETERIAAIVPGVGLFIGDDAGEAPAEPERIGEALVSRAGGGFDYLGELTLRVAGGEIVDWSFVLHDVRAMVESGELYPDARVDRLIQRYESEIAAAASQVIGYTDVPLDVRDVHVRSEESAIGNLVTDAMRAWAGADVAIQNGGGFRADRVFGPGPLTRRDILAILPFEDYVVKLRLRGDRLLAVLEHWVATVEDLDGYFPQVSGLAFAFDPTRPPGNRILAVTVGGAPLDPESWYTLATNDFLAAGGDGYVLLTDAEVILPASPNGLLSAIVMRTIEAAGHVAPRVEGRIALGRIGP